MESRISSIDEATNYKEALTIFHSGLPKATCLDVVLDWGFFDTRDLYAIRDSLKKSGIVFRMWDKNLSLWYKNTSALPSTTEPLHVVFLERLYKKEARRNIFAIDGNFYEFTPAGIKDRDHPAILHKRIVQALGLSGAANCQIDVCYNYGRFVTPDDGVYFQRVEKSKIVDNHPYDSPYAPLVSDYYLLYHPRSFFNPEIQPDWDTLFNIYQSKIKADDALISMPIRPLPEVSLLKKFCGFSVIQANEFIETYFNQWSESYLLAAKHKNDNPYAQLWYVLITHDVSTIDWELIKNSLEILKLDESNLLTRQELNSITRILMDMRTIILDKKMPTSYESHYLNLRRADLKKANLAGADLSYICFSRVDFRDANLEGTIFTGAHFSRVNFINAKLSGAVFRGAHFLGAGLLERI